MYIYIYTYIFNRCAHSAGPRLSLVGPQHERYVQMFASTSVSDEMFWLECCFGTCQNTKWGPSEVSGGPSEVSGVALGSWRGPGRPLGRPLEALGELRSDFGGLGGLWGQSCQSRIDQITLIFNMFLVPHVFRWFFVRILYRVIAPEYVKNW